MLVCAALVDMINCDPLLSILAIDWALVLLSVGPTPFPLFISPVALAITLSFNIIVHPWLALDVDELHHQVLKHLVSILDFKLFDLVDAVQLDVVLVLC